MDDRERKIRDRAYEIWERAGRPQGQEGEHWAQAMQEVDSGSNGPGSAEHSTYSPLTGASASGQPANPDDVRSGTGEGETAGASARPARKKPAAADATKPASASAKTSAKKPATASAKKPVTAVGEKPPSKPRKKKADG